METDRLSWPVPRHHLPMRTVGTATLRLLSSALLASALAWAQANDPLAPSLRPAISTNPGDYPSNVWITGSLAKVKPEALPGAVHWAEISAARNEFESFQVHVRAVDRPIQLDVTVSDLIGPSGRRIPADPNVEIFRESYSDVKQVSDLNGTPGKIPDALIPVRDSIFHEARNAFPVTVPVGQTRSAWIDVFVPAETASGYYQGAVTVRDGQTTLARLPVLLKVWNFQLPSTATLKSAFGVGYAALAFAEYKDYAGAGKFPGANGDAELGLALSHAEVAKFFLDHRVSLSAVAVQPTFTSGDWSRFDKVYGPLLRGTSDTKLKGARLTAFQYPNNSRFDAADLRDYMAHFQKEGWLPALFNYVCDEPPAGCSWAQLTQKALSFRQVAPAQRNLVTTNIDFARREKVLDNLDILAVVLNEMFPKDRGDQRSKYDSWLALPGKQLWWYQSCNQHESCGNGYSGPKSSTWPSYMIDASPVRNRIFQWLAYLEHIQGELYYATDIWGTDPWDHLYAFGGNGDGALYYPGTVEKIGGRRPIPVASIRLKLIRDGMEDYEYLHALDVAGEGDFARKVSLGFIQNVITFNDNPEALMTAREQLGGRLHALSLGAKR